MTYYSWLLYASKKLSNFKNNWLDSEVLLEYVTGKDRCYIFSHYETKLSEKEKIFLDFLLEKRLKNFPLAYLIQKKEFWSLSLKISPFVFIPRFDTEFLVEKALTFLNKNQYSKILDLGTGSGAIALALGSECYKFKIIGIDISEFAVFLAKFNARRLLINNVIFLTGNWFSSLPIQKFDMIVTNPPYLDKDDPCINKGDLQFEPKISLISKNQGLFDINLIINKSRLYLKNNGLIIIEHSFMQIKKIRKIFFYYDYKDVVTFKYCGGFYCVSCGRWKKNGKESKF